MSKVEWNRARANQRFMGSGGTTIWVPKTSAERLALVVRLRRLKADFLRRQEVGR